MIPSKKDRKSRKFEEFLDDLRADDPEFAAEYDKLGPRYNAISQVIKARRATKTTQTDLATRMGVNPNVVSRLESAAHSPRLETLALAAMAMGYECRIKFVRRATPAARKRAGRRSSPARRPAIKRSVASRSWGR